MSRDALALACTDFFSDNLEKYAEVYSAFVTYYVSRSKGMYLSPKKWNLLTIWLFCHKFLRHISHEKESLQME